MGYKVAIVGATGNVGREILNVLAERTRPEPAHAEITFQNLVDAPKRTGMGHSRVQGIAFGVFAGARTVPVTTAPRPRRP